MLMRNLKSWPIAITPDQREELVRQTGARGMSRLIRSALRTALVVPPAADTTVGPYVVMSAGLSRELLRQVDALRGEIPRSAFIRAALAAYLKGLKECQDAL